ncbi:MAG: hypothetical protein LQ337_001742 [Flavoplaca oasis]|nr:MAG: hypothetical protein LQ337_001742 [Flavoplaca oasis]
MESIRNAMGYGVQSGQEPLSGQTGQGTADEPYDSGNLAGQSGAPSSDATSTNPTGTTQFDTGTDPKGETTGYGSADNVTNISQYTSGDKDTTSASQYPSRDKNSSASETLAAGLSTDEHGFSDAPADKQSLGTSTAGDTSRAAAGDTSGAAQKGTAETRGADEQVGDEHPQNTNDTNANAQETFFANAGLSKDKPANPPKVASEIADKDPFASSGGASSNDTTDEPIGQSAAPSSSDTTSGANNLDKISSTAPDKNYKTVDTEPHPQSSEVLSSATPGAALDGQTTSQTSGHDNSTPSAAGGSGSGNDATNSALASSVHDDNTTTTSTTDEKSGYGNDPAVSGSNSNDYDNITSSTTTAAAADTDYPSPKTQPTESAGGLAGVSHNTGSAPSAPGTGVSDSSLEQAASQGAGETNNQGEGGKKKMSEKIKEKLHLGKK